jgi:plastocyanin
MFYLAFASARAGYSCDERHATANATLTVKIMPGAFTPASVTINSGDTVTGRTTRTGMHQVVSDDGAFVSPVLKAGQSYSFTFKARGKYVYHDALHPR